MMERGIWPMLRLVLLGSQRRSMPLVCSLVARCQGDRGVAEIDRETGLLFDRAPLAHFSSLVPGERFPQRFGNAGEGVADGLAVWGAR